MARRKGANAERAVAAWLQDNGFPHAERRLSGAENDRGDIAELGGGLVIEVKNQASLDLAGWVRQLENELINARADVGAVIAKRRSHTNVDDWYAILPARVLVRLLRDAGYGDPR